MRPSIQKAALVVTVMATLSAMSSCASVPRMKKETLRKMLGSPDVIVVDVRQPRYRKKSGQRIKGAVCEDPNRVKDWIGRFPKDKTIVFYCA